MKISTARFGKIWRWTVMDSDGCCVGGGFARTKDSAMSDAKVVMLAAVVVAGSPVELLLDAANRAGQATQALRDANIGTGAVLGDAVLALIGRAADLKRDIARLAEAVRQDEGEVVL